MMADKLFEVAKAQLIRDAQAFSVGAFDYLSAGWPRAPHVHDDGSIDWPRGSERDSYDVDLVRRADDGGDRAALELLHRDCVRATIAWNRFLAAGMFRLPASCPGSLANLYA